jgi:erythromycin esterase
MPNETNSTRRTDEQHEKHLPSAGVRAGLRDATVPVGTTDPAAATGADLASVGDRLADAAVVGLGEATHGTREFFQLKHRLLRELVVEHGVRAFAMEANLPEAMALDEYVARGDGDPSDALAAVYFWTWQTEAVLAMLEWLRAFNEGRPLADRVRVYGFDAQYTRGAVERLREHFDTVDPAFLAAVDDDLDVLDDEAEPPTEPSTETIEERMEVADRVLPRLREHLAANRDASVAATSAESHERVTRYVDVIEQAVDYAAALDAFDDGGDDADDDAGDEDFDDDAMAHLMRMRDGAMAENVAWLREHAAAETLVLWAHDAHLNRVEQAGPDGNVAAPSLGAHLAQRHGDDYYALGFSFATGAFQAMSEGADGEYALREQRVDGPAPGTFDAAMDALDEPLAVLDVRAASTDERTAQWLAEPREAFRTGGTYDTDDPTDQLVEYAYADAFDGVCFVAETTRARPLPGVDAVPDDADDGRGEGDD